MEFLFLFNTSIYINYSIMPYPVLFDKSRHIVPDFFWKLLYNWYSAISVRTEWYTLGKDIQICKGTRQGGLTSPFLFNIFY